MCKGGKNCHLGDMSESNDRVSKWSGHGNERSMSACPGTRNAGNAGGNLGVATQISLKEGCVSTPMSAEETPRDSAKPLSNCEIASALMTLAQFLAARREDPFK